MNFPARLNPFTESGSLKLYGAWVCNGDWASERTAGDKPEPWNGSDLRTWAMDSLRGDRVPGDTTRIAVYRENIVAKITTASLHGDTPYAKAFLARRGVTPEQFRDYVQSNLPELTRKFIVTNVRHELLHLTGRKHHPSEDDTSWDHWSLGDYHCPMRYWFDRGDTKLTFLMGKWDSIAKTIAPPGDELNDPLDPPKEWITSLEDWAVCDDCKRQLRLKN